MINQSKLKGTSIFAEYSNQYTHESERLEKIVWLKYNTYYTFN